MQKKHYICRMKITILTYLLLVSLQLVGTLVFMTCHLSGVDGVTAFDWVQVLWNSLPHHLCMSGYVMAVPLLLWTYLPIRRVIRFNHIFVSVLATLVCLLWVVDNVLYGYWHTRLDATPLFYFLEDPVTILSQTPLWVPLAGLAFCAGFAFGFYRLLSWIISRDWMQPHRLTSWMQYLVHLLLSFAMCGLLFLAIRGGLGEGSMNIGRAYFSDRVQLNHAAVNPAFSFFYSFGKNEDFASMYRFMTDDECALAVADLEQSTTGNAQPMQLLRTKRPNIVLLVFESFSGKACNALYPEANPQIMPTFNRLYADTTAVRFRSFYCNSYRTDRGMAAIFASYPGQPTTSVMKHQTKCDNLDYWTQHLRTVGYDMQFVHGGDVNFTNTQGFLRSAGIADIMGENDFPHEQRTQKWGVPDHIVFDYLADCIIQDSHNADGPFFWSMLTLSSHEPFDVPFHRLDDVYENSVAYTDSAFGVFIDRLKADTAVWNNLLIIAMPDHCYINYPEGIALQSEHRFHAPCIWTGGAVNGHEVNTIGMQIDLGATLLSQMDIPHDDMNFSHDILDPESGHYAFYAWYDGLGLKTDSLLYTQDNEDDLQPLPGTCDPDGRAQRWGRAYLQNLMNDLNRR